MERVFGQVCDKKRLAPGQLTRVTGESIRHDCSTLDGDSGVVGRQGYREEFLGNGARLPLPGVKRDQNDVLTFNFDGNMERVLRYEHFSVVMSKGRRLCRFSAVNIDGRESKSFPRGAWPPILAFRILVSPFTRATDRKRPVSGAAAGVADSGATACAHRTGDSSAHADCRRTAFRISHRSSEWGFSLGITRC
jgi:hypothetical protein